jgi:hypothetical protein
MKDSCILYGALRSGTTMLRLMMDHHPQLTCPGEADFLTDALRPGNGPSGWKYDPDHLLDDRIFRASLAALPESEDAGVAFRDMTGHLRGGTEGCLVLDIHRGIDRILDLAPDVPIVHLVRDPRDVARSAIGMGWAGNVYHGADIWLSAEQVWQENLSRFAPGQVHEVRYEALVRAPEATLSGICDFLGIDYAPGMLEYGDDSTYTAPDTSLVEQWRRKQTPRDLGLVEPLFGDLLEARGYAPSGHPPISPNRFQRMGLMAENKWGAWQTRVSRYGIADPLLLAVSRRLYLDGLARRTKRRIDEKTLSYLK